VALIRLLPVLLQLLAAAAAGRVADLLLHLMVGLAAALATIQLQVVLEQVGKETQAVAAQIFRPASPVAAVAALVP
jgi:hypothetical protein